MRVGSRRRKAAPAAIRVPGVARPQRTRRLRAQPKVSADMTTSLVHELIQHSTARTPHANAITYKDTQLTYAALQAQVENFARGLIGLELCRAERVAIYLEKCCEFVAACFGSSAAGAVFVPVNPLLKPDQVAHILRDCSARVLVTSADRLQLLLEVLGHAPDLRHVIVVGGGVAQRPLNGLHVQRWESVLDGGRSPCHRVIDSDMAAILYTSGSTGRPKGVVLSHRNLVAGAKSVASYLENRADDVLLAALPLSFDAGFSQLTTAFHVGARVVLVNYLLPRDVLNAVVREQVTGLTAVPPLWIQLSQLEWPAEVTRHLRYIANTGGRMPLETLTRLRVQLPRTRPYLMYGLTEAFRATYLPPEQVDRRPDSIGKAIPNAEVLVLREDGTVCDANEPGELVQRGALVAMGYWNDVQKTSERFRPLPARDPGLVLPEIAVFSGDTVRRDEEGFLYFIGRRDEMIKTSGYRVSPMEIEEVLYDSALVGEAAAFGVEHPVLGQAIVVVVTPRTGAALEPDQVAQACRARLPAYMIPAHVSVRGAPLPRNPNGKIDRKQLAAQFDGLFREPA
jgi:acyl-CoA ligase (AMP-forming) (exosortase A-associated)